jgi:predicted RND superfamily exporter protein
VLALIDSAAKTMETRETLLASLASQAEIQLEAASDTDYDTWDEVLLFLDEERQRTEIFKQPEALNYLDHLQQHLLDTGIVGKSNSVVDVVKTVHRELLLGEDKEFRIPDSARAIAQTLITYQNSHRPHHLWHFITPDYRKAVLWLQLTSGDNRDMDIVKQAVADFTAGNPPPMGLKPNWFGLTYINTVWQDKMVSGMLKAFMGSFVVVLLMMVFLFRSLWWGLLSMIPLTVTVGLIYGIIGLIGKNYDMPVAVLSSLSLGLAVDYAIHFLVRSREARKRHDSWRKCISEIFGEPARAITRNAIILGAGFLPLLAAPLVPYKTVGIFIATIIVSAGAATLLILTALIRILEKWLFKPDIGSSSG